MNGEFYNMDCMKALLQFEDNHFDLAIVDPPYGIGNFWQGGDTSAQNKIKLLRKNENNWNDDTPKSQYWNQLKRVSKNRIIWGWNYYTKELGSSESLIIWWKNLGAPNYSQCEIAMTSFSHKIKFYRYDLAKDNKNRTHPCQKPIAIYKWLLKNYAKEGDLILDTHVGSASSLIACEDMGFKYVGYELDEDYYNSAMKRLKNHISQLKMF